MTRLIVLQRTSAAEAEGRLPKNLGIGRLCSASVIVCTNNEPGFNTNIFNNEPGFNTNILITTVLFYFFFFFEKLRSNVPSLNQPSLNNNIPSLKNNEPGLNTNKLIMPPFFE